MALPRTPALIALVTVLVTFAGHTTSHAKPRRVTDDHVMTLERWLLPDAVADRIEGSGVDCRSIADEGGARHKLHIGFVRLNITEHIAIRAGIGMAKMSALPMGPEENGMAVGGGVAYAFWKRDRYSLNLEVSAVRARYHQGGMTDGIVMLAFRGR